MAWRSTTIRLHAHQRVCGVLARLFSFGPVGGREKRQVFLLSVGSGATGCAVLSVPLLSWDEADREMNVETVDWTRARNLKEGKRRMSLNSGL